MYDCASGDAPAAADVWQSLIGAPLDAPPPAVADNSNAGGATPVFAAALVAYPALVVPAAGLLTALSAGAAGSGGVNATIATRLLTVAEARDVGAGEMTRPGGNRSAWRGGRR